MTKKYTLISLCLLCLISSSAMAGVNPENGNFFFPMTDYQRSCHNMSISIQRSYNSMNTQSGVFGKSWIANFERYIIPLSNNSLELIEADGFVSRFYLKHLLDDKDKSIKQIITNKKLADIKHSGNPKGKAASHYRTLEEKMQLDQEYFLKMLNRYIQKKPSMKNMLFSSKDRRYSELKKNKDGFVRHFENGQEEHYNKQGKLILEKDPHNTLVRYLYRNQELKTIRDSCGQYLNLEYDKKNRIIKISDHVGRSTTYTYDDKNIKNTLSLFTGTDSQNLRFQYDIHARIKKLIFSQGEQISLVYDDKNGKVKQHFGPKKNQAYYSYSQSRGIQTTVVKDQSKKVHRYQYIPAESKSIYTPPKGNKIIKKTMACCGKIKSITNEKGQGTFFKYNDIKQVIEKKSTQDETISYRYNSKKLLDLIRQGTYSINIEYNAQEQPIHTYTSQKKYVKANYNEHGMLRMLYDQSNDRIHITYTNNGDIKEINLQTPTNDYSYILSYSQKGDIIKTTLNPNTLQTQQKIQSTLRQMLDFLQSSAYLPKP